MDCASLYRALVAMCPPRSAATVEAVAHAAVRTGAVPSAIADCLDTSLDLAELRVRTAMVPRVDIPGISAERPIEEAAHQMDDSGSPHMLVFDGSIDQPVGVLHAIDVAAVLARTRTDHSAPTAGMLARPVPTVPDTLLLIHALDVMRSHETRTLLVADERGGLAGLVTTHEVLDQLVGLIPDEFAQRRRAIVRKLGEGEAIVGAAVSLHELARTLRVHFPEGSFTSIGGLTYALLGRVPAVGDVVELPGMRIEVLSVDGTQVRELRVRAGVAVSRNGALVDLELGSDVLCGAEVVGNLERLVVDPVSGRVTNVIISHRDRAVLVPLDHIEKDDNGVAYLGQSACDLDQMPEYDPLADILHHDLLHERGNTGARPCVEISRHAVVGCADGTLGSVRHVLLDKHSGAVTHVVVRCGWLQPRDVVVPLSWTRSISQCRIELAVTCYDVLNQPGFRSDDEIWVEIRRRLQEDPRFGGIERYTLQVEVHGGVVRLQGRVRTDTVKMAAEQVARSVPGVLTVDNELRSDDEIARNVAKALAQADLATLDVGVLLGDVKLRGAVQSAAQRDVAIRLARNVAGVRSVQADFVVEPAIAKSRD